MNHRRSAPGFPLALGLGLSLWLGSCGTGTSPAKGLVILNEIQCHGGDWVEIVNVSDSVQDLSAWSVADSLTKDGHQYQLPDGTVLQIGEYLIVREQNDTAAGFAFGIKCGEETVYLLDAGQGIVDEVETGSITYGNTWGRLPDLTGLWRETSATPGEPNQPPASGLE